jgi:hypothetical protein
MFSKTTFAALAAVAATSLPTSLAATAQPSGTIGFSYNAGSNATAAGYLTVAYTQWGQNITLNNTSATSVSLVASSSWGQSDAECLFQTGGNPGGLHVSSLNSTEAIATNNVQVYWICCGYSSQTQDYCGLDELSVNSTTGTIGGNSTQSGNATSIVLSTTLASASRTSGLSTVTSTTEATGSDAAASTTTTASGSGASATSGSTTSAPATTQSASAAAAGGLKSGSGSGLALVVFAGFGILL